MCDFSLKMAKELMQPDENLFFSPASIQMALGMLLAGAGGRSADELRSVVFSEVDESVVHNRLGALISKINGPQNGLELSTANRLYIQDGFEALQGFMDTLDQFYGSGFKQVNFANNEDVRKEINEWAEGATNGRIKGIIPKGILTALTRLVIVNAIYFKGKWSESFPKDVRTENFHVNANKHTKVSMMAHKRIVPYYQDDKSQAIMLKYNGGISMMVILPKQKFGLQELLTSVDGTYLQKIASRAKRIRVHVKIPKFKIEQEFKLNTVLKKLGVEQVFGREANLSRIASGLYVTAVLHKAFVEVDEYGTKAAAATAVVSDLRSDQPPPPYYKPFIANRPFVAAIWYQNAPLFFTVVNDPTAG